MTSRVEHTDVGAYALGLLEEDDHRAFEEHLRDCDECAAELNEMTGLAEALSGVAQYTDAGAEELVADEREATGGAEAAPPRAAEPAGGGDEPPAQVIDLLRRRRTAERRFRRGTYVIGAAAAAALFATGVTVGTSIGNDGTASVPDGGHSAHGGPPQGSAQGPAQSLVVWGERYEAKDAKTGASGAVGLESKGWGTHVGLELRNVKGPLRCHLEAVSRDGERSVVTGWQVPAKGYGVPGAPQPLVTHGGTGIRRPEIARFEVRIDGGGGGTLLTIPV
ncbi:MULTISPECIES: anti-sigma factor family protein [Actinomadura]|uniref:Anti-sigma factor family protein n=1 Tax=Actinomadura yumaensis TaxID=111807 RepID=A0ABW2CA12_9ACTN|nr:zf-HC2 domain-containing protein [Actinomadura sp. J1-007]MWK33683.1 RNA polymerase subunit sigma [Actinomadura sp. J1-007]